MNRRGFCFESEDGQPCPVCGSREHPQIAALSDEAPTQAEVELAKAERDKKEKNKRYKKQKHSGNVFAGYQGSTGNLSDTSKEYKR